MTDPDAGPEPRAAAGTTVLRIVPSTAARTRTRSTARGPRKVSGSRARQRADSLRVLPGSHFIYRCAGRHSVVAPNSERRKFS